MQYNWTKKRKEELIHATMWMNPEDAMLIERSHVLYESIDIKHPESILVVIMGCRGDKIGNAGFMGY